MLHANALEKQFASYSSSREWYRKWEKEERVQCFVKWKWINEKDVFKNQSASAQQQQHLEKYLVHSRKRDKFKINRPGGKRSELIQGKPPLSNSSLFSLQEGSDNGKRTVSTVFFSSFSFFLAEAKKIRGTFHKIFSDGIHKSHHTSWKYDGRSQEPRKHKEVYLRLSLMRESSFYLQPDSWMYRCHQQHQNLRFTRERTPKETEE